MDSRCVADLSSAGFVPGMGPGSTTGTIMRSTRLTVTLAIAAAFVPVLPARAATFSSPLLTALAGGQSQCRVSNVGTTSINVSGTFYDIFGNVVAPVADTCAMMGGVLPALQTCILSHGTGAVRCVVNASSSKVRVLLMTMDNAGVTLATEPATKK
jgi:hypothetical protein